MKKTNVLIVDDHAMVRETLCDELRKHPLVEDAYEAEDEESFIKALDSHDIGLILLDIKLRHINGLELLKHLEGRGKRPYIIGLTGTDGGQSVFNLMRFGAEGVVYKLDPFSELRQAIECVLDNGFYFSKSVKGFISRRLHLWNDGPSVILSPREKEFLKAIADGLTTAQIAPLFKMSEDYAEKCRRELIKKTQVPNSAALVAFAFRNGIL
jgi:DNA-binding NarL/FixJ family response regulator